MAVKKYKTQIESKFGERLKKYRIKRGYNTVEEFGMIFNDGKKHKDFSAYEKGKNIRHDTLFKFCFYLKVEVTDFLNFKIKVTPEAEMFNNMMDWRDYAEEKHLTFIENFKSLRRLSGLSQLDLESRLNITRENITNYERGIIKPTLITMDTFAYAFDLEIWQLFLKNETE
jgi:transcriptional regulator with XRE-family HTH domain